MCKTPFSILKHPVGVTSLEPGIETRWSRTKLISIPSFPFKSPFPFSFQVCEPAVAVDTSFATQFFQCPLRPLIFRKATSGVLLPLSLFRETTPPIGANICRADKFNGVVARVREGPPLAGL